MTASENFIIIQNNHQNIKNVIQHKTDEFSHEFKDLVVKMLSYNFLDRPTLD
jgi:hypothetical protein